MFDKAKILFTGPNWQDQTTTWRKLFEQRGRNVGTGSSDYDTVKWTGFGQAELSIGMFKANIELLQDPHVGFGLFQQWAKTLNGIDILGQLRQNGSLITTTSTDLQGFTQRASPVEQEFDHPRHDKRLGNSLPHTKR